MNHAIKTLENRLSNLKKAKDTNTLIHEEHAKEAATAVFKKYEELTQYND